MSRCARSHCRIVVLDADKLRSDALCRATRRVFPHAEVQRRADPKDLPGLIANGPIWLLIVSLDFSAGDMMALLMKRCPTNDTIAHLLVVTARREQRIMMLLSSARLDGIFDPATEGVELFGDALHAILVGRRYFSPSVAATVARWKNSPRAIARLLTVKEQLVLSVIGDGRDDRAAAQVLQLRPSTIQSLRRNIHRKLGLSHKGELVRAAAQHGFVQFTAEGVIQPAFGCAVTPGLAHAR